MALFKMRVLELSGTPRERGRQHGEELREPIGRHYDLYRENIEQDTGLSSQEYLDQFLANTNFLPAAEKYAPDLLDELRGIAEGSGRSFQEVFARMLSDEDPWYRQMVKFGRGVPEHCSCLGSREGGRSLIAQNMDSPLYYDGFQTILHIHEPDSDLESLIFTVAGKISLAGMNNYGVGICCNSVLFLDFNVRGLAEDFIVRKVLQQKSLEDALTFMRSVPHASGQNYVLGDPSHVTDLECSGSKVIEIPMQAGSNRFAHTNHPLNNDDTGSWDAMWKRGEQQNPELIEALKSRMTTYNRYNTLQIGIQADLPLDVNRAKALLSDHTAPVCQHHIHHQNYTLGCLIMELDAQTPRLIAAAGPPCSTPFRTYTFHS